MRPLLLLSLLSMPLYGAQQIEIVAHFADVPAGVEIPAQPDGLSKSKEITLLSSPRIIVAEDSPGKVEVVQATPVPGGGQVGLGVSLGVKANVTEKGNVWFSGQVTDRSRGGGQKTDRLETAGFATREWYFSGYTPSGGTVLIRTTPVTSQSVREGKTVATSRELVVYLTFSKGAAKPSGTSKITPAPKGSNSIKKTPTKKR